MGSLYRRDRSFREPRGGESWLSPVMSEVLELLTLLPIEVREPRTERFHWFVWCLYLVSLPGLH